MMKNLRYLSLIVIGEMLLPIAFKHLPFPLYSHFFWQILWILALLFFNSRIFTQKPLIYSYFGLIFFSITYLVFDRPEGQASAWFGYFIDIVVSLTLLQFVLYQPIHFVNRMAKFLLFAVVFSSLTTLIGYTLFPESVRFNASYGGEVELDMVKFYESIGIMDYGFIYGLSMSIPIFYIWLKTEISNEKKYYFIAFGLIIILVITRSDFATAFLLMTVGILFNFIGYNSFRKYRFLIYASTSFILLIPNSFYSNTLLWISDFISSESILRSRLIDLSSTILGQDDTHVQGRLDRIPELVESFFSSPIYGTGFTTGHNFILDLLSSFGILGLIPYLYLFLRLNNDFGKLLSKKYKYFFFLTLLLFLIYTPFKGAPGGKIYLFILFINPVILIYIQEKYKKNLLNETK
jgi:hypothetical protein